ncbi:hypothetical protein PITC_041880 [Penicillium italicum]|uniref:Uncharacterized protein n=1 Tax=Penicillium italicum TaxID=40296 RepID=A0A0A2KAX4_PENIT|nr:hypothetical protein PITC_041880 [Penicillium italicum]
MTGCGNNHVGRARSCGFTASCFPPLACRRGTEHYLILRSSISGYAVTRCCGGLMLGCMLTVVWLVWSYCSI